MIEAIFERIKQAILPKNDNRTRLASINIMVSLIAKGVAVLTSFALVPLTLRILDKELYGVWLTISSILFWFTFFDIGLGNGMRNYLAEALAVKDYTKAKQYVSTTFILLFLIALSFAIIAIIFLPWLDFQQIYNTTTETQETLESATLTAILLTIAFLAVRNVGTLYVSMQMPAVNDALGVLGSVFTLLAIFLIILSANGNILWVVAAYTIPPVVLFALAAVPTFRKYPHLRPTANDLNFSLGKNIVSKGLGFFLIQITSCLVIYGSSNLFVTQYCGPVEVTRYGIAYKFFNLLTVAYTVFLTPYWNAYTDAYAKNDIDWIKKTFRKTMLGWGVLAVVGVCMFVVAPFFYSLWIGDEVVIPWSVSLVTMAYILMFNLNSCATFLINGLNKIRVQMITSVVFTVLYIVAVITIDGRYGIEGIVLSMAITYFLMTVIHLYQCRLFLQQKAKGIWNK